jgi:hypothetical protein
MWAKLNTYSYSHFVKNTSHYALHDSFVSHLPATERMSSKVLCVQAPQIYSLPVTETRPITVAARFKTQNVIAQSNTGIEGSNLTRGVDICLPLFRVCVVLCR